MQESLRIWIQIRHWSVHQLSTYLRSRCEGSEADVEWVCRTDSLGVISNVQNGEFSLFTQLYGFEAPGKQYKLLSRYWLRSCNFSTPSLAVIRSRLLILSYVTLSAKYLCTLDPSPTDLYSSGIKRNERRRRWSCSTIVQRTLSLYLSFPSPFPAFVRFPRSMYWSSCLSRDRCHKTFNDPKLGKRAWRTLYSIISHLSFSVSFSLSLFSRVTAGRYSLL